MKRHKLLLVSPCQGTYGGIEAFVLAVAEAVRREPDFEVRVCFKRVKDFALHPNLATMLRHESFTFVDRAGGELAAAVKWADIVHLQNASPDVVALAKFYGKRIVLTIHNYMLRELSASVALAGERKIDGRALVQFELCLENVGISQAPWQSKNADDFEAAGKGWTPPHERSGFVFIGRWIANKGIETLLEAYAQADLDRAAWPLLLLGDGPLRPSLQAKIDNQRISGIRVEGFVDEATKAKHMQQARWVVVPPNTNEDFGLTAVEARNLGVPCIITRDGGLPEAGGQQALICEPGDARGLANLLEQASRMSETEYAERATRTREELAHELEPMDFYARAYRRILAGEAMD